MRISPFEPGYIMKQIDKAASGRDAKNAILKQFHNGATSNEPKGPNGEGNAMERAKLNIARRRLKMAGLDEKTGERIPGSKYRSVHDVMGENRDNSTPEQKAARLAATQRANADHAASLASASTRVMQDEQPSQSAFGQANRSGSLSSRGPTKVGRRYNDPERANERWAKRNEQSARLAYGF